MANKIYTVLCCAAINNMYTAYEDIDNIFVGGRSLNQGREAQTNFSFGLGVKLTSLGAPMQLLKEKSTLKFLRVTYDKNTFKNTHAMHTQCNVQIQFKTKT